MWSWTSHSTYWSFTFLIQKMGTRMLCRNPERVKCDKESCDKSCKMLGTEPRSEDALIKWGWFYSEAVLRLEKLRCGFQWGHLYCLAGCRCLHSCIWDLDSPLADADVHHRPPGLGPDLREGGMRLGFWAALAWAQGVGRSQTSKTQTLLLLPCSEVCGQRQGLNDLFF